MFHVFYWYCACRLMEYTNILHFSLAIAVSDNNRLPVGTKKIITAVWESSVQNHL